MSFKSEKGGMVQAPMLAGAIAAAALKKRPDALLNNIMKLDELIRVTSREENPKPNYNRLIEGDREVDELSRKKELSKGRTNMRTANIQKLFKGKKQVEEPMRPTKEVEREIISTTVEEMIAQIHKKRLAYEKAQDNANFKRPLKYFESKGAKKAQMHTEKKTLITR